VDKATGKETMWLKDLLPNYIPNCRISTFGYRLDKEGFSISGIKKKAMELLDALYEHRSPDMVNSKALAASLAICQTPDGSPCNSRISLSFLLVITSEGQS